MKGTPQQTEAAEQSKSPPKGATHEYGGAYYHERGDGQFLIYDPRERGWTMAEAVNCNMALAEKLRPIDTRNVWSDEPTPEEDEAWERLMAEHERQRNAPPSTYHVRINGGWADVYDVLYAFGVTNPADQHAIKKMLMPGKRGHKSAEADRREAIQSLKRAIELDA